MLGALQGNRDNMKTLVQGPECPGRCPAQQLRRPPHPRPGRAQGHHAQRGGSSPTGRTAARSRPGTQELVVTVPVHTGRGFAFRGSESVSSGSLFASGGFGAPHLLLPQPVRTGGRSKGPL